MTTLQQYRYGFITYLRDKQGVLFHQIAQDIAGDFARDGARGGGGGALDNLLGRALGRFGLFARYLVADGSAHDGAQSGGESGDDSFNNLGEDVGFLLFAFDRLLFVGLPDASALLWHCGGGSLFGLSHQDFVCTLAILGLIVLAKDAALSDDVTALPRGDGANLRQREKDLGALHDARRALRIQEADQRLARLQGSDGLFGFKFRKVSAAVRTAFWSLGV